jgi:hypothetical protein
MSLWDKERERDYEEMDFANALDLLVKKAEILVSEAREFKEGIWRVQEKLKEFEEIMGSLAGLGSKTPPESLQNAPGSTIASKPLSGYPVGTHILVDEYTFRCSCGCSRREPCQEAECPHCNDPFVAWGRSPSDTVEGGIEDADVEERP